MFCAGDCLKCCNCLYFGNFLIENASEENVRGQHWWGLVYVKSLVDLITEIVDTFVNRTVYMRAPMYYNYVRENLSSIELQSLEMVRLFDNTGVK